MSLLKIKSALTKAFNDSSFGLRTSFENGKFTPTEGVSWCALKIFPNQPSAATLGVGGGDNHDGFMQVNLYYPLGEGDANVLAKADQIRAVFTVGASISYDGQEVKIKSCGISHGKVVGDWYRVTMTINWYARTQRGA